MKKLLSFFAMALCVLTSLSSCSNDTEYEGQEKQDNVKVTFIYTLDTSNGSAMSRATTNAEVFNEFYAKIKSGELVASSYNLTLTETTTGAVYTFKGEWNSHELVTLRTGVYNIVGESKAEGENIQEKCSFTFEEQIEINAESNTIILHANYDCYLLIFSNSNIESLENNNGSSQASFYTFGNYKYAFVNNKLFIEEYKNNAYIKGIYTDEAEFKIFTGNLNFEKGKYYVYNSISNGFDVPPMEEGGSTGSKLSVETYILDTTIHPYYIGGMIRNNNETIVKKGIIISIDENNLYYDSEAECLPPYLEIHNDKNRYDELYFDIEHKIIDCTNYGDAQFNIPVTCVLGTTKYFARAFAIDDRDEIIYGNVIEFVTANFNREIEKHHFANVFYSFYDEYTLFDLATDECIPMSDGFYSSTDENYTVCSYHTGGTYGTWFKFKTEWNHRLWYSNRHEMENVAGTPIMTYKNGKLYINKQEEDADKNIEIYYSVNENGRHPETFTQKYETPLEINVGDIVYCYAVNEGEYISYTNLYKRFSNQ